MKTSESLAQTVEDVNIPRGRKGGFAPKVVISKKKEENRRQ